MTRRDGGYYGSIDTTANLHGGNGGDQLLRKESATWEQLFRELLCWKQAARRICVSDDDSCDLQLSIKFCWWPRHGF